MKWFQKNTKLAEYDGRNEALGPSGKAEGTRETTHPEVERGQPPLPFFFFLIKLICNNLFRSTEIYSF